MNKINVGIIGFGNVGKKRFYYLKKIKEFNIKIIYICDKVFKNSFKKKNIAYINNWKKIDIQNRYFNHKPQRLHLKKFYHN